MKKRYVKPMAAPTAEILDAALMEMSGVTSDKGIGYGGVDNDGTVTPSARRDNLWNDEDTDDEE
ncbi:MAG: hypothetical protein IJP74_05250 [Prevotella sp.]|nr:hypothetical protein [Prevotella sp.]